MTAKTINWTYLITLTVTRMYMLGAATMSFTHIIETSRALGLGWEAWTVPFLVDGLAALGLIGRSTKFAPSTRRAGMALALGAGALSLACNVMAGHNLGQRLFGALVVAGFIATETYASRLHAAPTRAAADQVAVDALHAKRSEAAKRGAETRRRRAAAAAKAERASMRAARVALAATA